MVLLTGATGLLGRVILMDLLVKGHRVRALVRKNSPIEETLRSFTSYELDASQYTHLLEWYEVDFYDIEQLQSALIGIEHVCHSAAMVSFDPSERKNLFKSNVEVTQNLLYACEGLNLKKFLFVSSVATLDSINEEGYRDENSDFIAKNEHSDYAMSKHLAEMEVQRASAEGLPVVIINPSVIIGSGNWMKSSGALFGGLLRLPYAPSGLAGFVDVRDVSNIAVVLLLSEVEGERYVVVAENKSYHWMANQLRSRIAKPPIKILPLWSRGPLHLLSVFLSWAAPSLRLLRKRNFDAVHSQVKLNNEKVVRDLKYKFIPVEQSIEFHFTKYLEWKKNYNK